jgi:hypothetical protein
MSPSLHDAGTSNAGVPLTSLGRTYMSWNDPERGAALGVLWTLSYEQTWLLPTVTCASASSVMSASSLSAGSYWRSSASCSYAVGLLGPSSACAPVAATASEAMVRHARTAPALDVGQGR